MVTRTFSYAALCIGFLFTCALGTASFAQDTHGFRYNNLMVAPYVNLEYAYDSNVDRNKAEDADSILSISPGVDLSYTGNEWGLSGNAWFGYDRYVAFPVLDETRYGESLTFYRESAKGWRVTLGQKYLKSSQADSIIDGGQGLWRDRELFELTAAAAYQVTEKTGITLTGLFSDLYYANEQNPQKKYEPLYGWQEYGMGLEVARKLTEKSNLLLSGNYTEYITDGSTGAKAGAGDSSVGYSLMAGVGSRATERISYHALTGMDMFTYGGGEKLTGWTYSLDANWIISKKLAASIAGSSFFQPSEREANQAMQVYALSTGLSYRPMRKLTTRFDVAFRREENAFDAIGQTASTEDRYSARARADYQLKKYMSVYCGLEYEEQMSSASQSFVRYRGSLGLSFRY
jgi:hypothetical protein